MSLISNTIFDRPFVLSMGPQRAGTSWLDRYLRSRGDVCLPSEVKEIFYFDRHYHRGAEFYKGHFKLKPQHRLVMEVSTTSFDAADAPRHVFETFGEGVTFICPLRDPVARSYSLYLHYKRYGMVSGSLRKACLETPQIIESSRYADHLEQWYERYDPKAIAILFQEDLEADQEAYIKRVCSILNLPMMDVPTDVTGRYNATTQAPLPVLARVAQSAADFLRRHRLYGAINVAKAAGLKPLFFGVGLSEEKRVGGQSHSDDCDWLYEQLAREIEKFEALTGTKTSWAR